MTVNFLCRLAHSGAEPPFVALHGSTIQYIPKRAIDALALPVNASSS